MTRSEKKKRYDGMLIFVVLLLVAAGLVILYSTSAYNGQVKFHDPFHYLKKQGFATLLGLFGMALIARVDYHKWVPLAIPAYFSGMNTTGPKDGCLWARFLFSLQSLQK